MKQALRDADNIKIDDRNIKVLAFLNHIHQCQRCGKCCTGMMIGMTGEEVIRISKHLNMKGSEFKKRYIDCQVGRWMVLKHGPGEPCPFLKMDEGKSKCQIYEVRPRVCRNYPFLAPVVIENTKPPQIMGIEGMCQGMSRTVERYNKMILERKE